MELLTQAIRNSFPEWKSTDYMEAHEITVIVKFFTPDSNWTWYATEFDGDDTLFGLVRGLETELGYFRLSELAAIRGPLGLPIERDLYFGAHTLADVRRNAL